VYIVRRGNFRSRDKYGGYTIRSASISRKKPDAAGKLHGINYIEPELLPISVTLRKYIEFRIFGSCDLDLDTMTLIYEIDDIRSRYTSVTDGHTEGHTDRCTQTDATNTLSRRFAGGK